ncbi:MAG: hypothetical protein MJZ94_06745 [Bacteroidales bacterium]|nr:hypothetical protein [Bacteroidales bacterium]
MKTIRNLTIAMALLSLFIQFTSCSSMKLEQQCSHIECFSIQVPKDCFLAAHFVGEGEEEVIYMREDSACIYVSSSDHSPNDSNIRALADSIVKLRYQRNDVFKELDSLIGYEKFPIRSDTFELQGIDSAGLYWKDIIYDRPSTLYSIGISIGYSNVPKADKVIFDKALTTFVENGDQERLDECIELYGELEPKEVHITQDFVGFFGCDSCNLPIDDTIVITLPNKINPSIMSPSPTIKDYFAYHNGAVFFISKEPNLSSELEEELRQRIKNARNRIEGLDKSEGEKFFVPETAIKEGIDENGLRWITVNEEFMSFGYSHVPPEHKWYFDKILESFHKKTPSYQEVFEEMSKEL